MSEETPIMPQGYDSLMPHIQRHIPSVDQVERAGNLILAALVYRGHESPCECKSCKLLNEALHLMGNSKPIPSARIFEQAEADRDSALARVTELEKENAQLRGAGQNLAQELSRVLDRESKTLAQLEEQKRTHDKEKSDAISALQKMDWINAENDRLKQELGWVESARDKFETTCAQLRAELARVEGDGKRLDWLDKNWIKIFETGKEWHDKLSMHGPDLRSAIDAAMSAKGAA